MDAIMTKQKGRPKGRANQHPTRAGRPEILNRDGTSWQTFRRNCDRFLRSRGLDTEPMPSGWAEA